MTDFLKRKLKQLGKLAREKMPSKRAMFLFTFLAVVFSVFLALPAGAQSVDDIGRGLMKGAANIVLSMAELCIRLSVFCLQFFISLAQWNNYIDIPIVMLGWTMVRDVANMFFVIIFLIIAIGTILGLEQYQWNKTLAKMVLAAVFINFSNLICGIFIDIAHVFTITFVNAISATAGGNLINMFKLDQIFKLTTDTSALGSNKTAEGNIDMRLLSASVAAFLFAGLSLITIAVYTVIMLYRVIILWVLIILSPIAYISSILPQSQSYAKEWWDEFSRYVLVAPMMVFFLWLAFATMGAGNIASDEKSGMGLKVALSRTVDEGSYTADELGSGDAAASLSEVTKWANLANILIPICLLWVGMERVQKLGVRGGDMVGKGMDFFKKAATVATGVAAGRWLVGKGSDLGKTGLKKAAWFFPVVGGRRWGQRWKNEKASIGNWWYGKGAGLNKAGMEARGELADKKSELETKRLAIDRAATPEEKARLQGQAAVLEQEAGALEEKMKANTSSGGLVGWMARRDVGFEKQIKKSEGQLAIRRDIAFKRVPGDSGGILFNRANTQMMDQYRYEKGALEAESARGAAKDKEFSEKGRMGVMAVERYKEGEFKEGKGTIAEQIAEHGRGTAKAENIIKAVQAGAEIKININAKQEVDNVRNQQLALDKTLEGFLTPEERAKKAKLEEEKNGAAGKVAAVDAEFAPKIEEAKDKLAKKMLLRGKKGERAQQVAKEKLAEIENARQEKINAVNQGVTVAADDLKRYQETDEAKNYQQNPEYQARAAEVAAQKMELEAGLRAANIPGVGGFMAAQQAALAESLSETTKSELQGGMLGLSGQQELLSAINLSEQAKKGAEEFMKTIKESNFEKQFSEAAKKMNEWLKLGANDFKKKMEEGLAGKHGGFVTAMANGQIAKEQEEDTALARRTAEDAAYDVFVSKPRYGTISPSTAFSEYAKKKMDDYRKLERVAAYKKATDTFTHLQGIKDGGGDLGEGQKAQLAAAVSFLTEEAWVDDKGEYMFNMLKKLRDGGLENPEDAEEKTKWQSIAKMVHKIGWISGENAVDKDGNISKEAKIENTYGREQAADLQNLAMTGLDVDLVAAHKGVSKKVDENRRALTAAAEVETANQVEEAMKSDEFKDVREQATVAATDGAEENWNKRYETAKKMVTAQAQKEAKDKKMDGATTASYVATQVAKVDEAFSDKNKAEEVAASVNQAVKAAVAKAAEEKIKKQVGEAIEALKKEKGLETDYWKVADSVLGSGEGKLNIAGIGNKQQLKDRYEQHSDLLQFATRTFKKNALETGHEELGMNQDYDDAEDVYRFQTVEEGRAKIRADRVKIDRSKLLNGDQYHSNGKLDYNTMILDDFLEDAIGITLGKVTKAIELTRVPERSLKGYFYVHKNADAEVQMKKGDDGKVRNYAVIGGSKAREKFENDGDVTEEDQRNHMLARGMLTHLVAGWRGMALGSHKLFNHVSEKQAQQGIVNLKIGDKQFETVQQMAHFVAEKIESRDVAFMKQFNQSEYRGQEQRILRKMREIENERPQADFTPSSEEHETASQE